MATKTHVYDGSNWRTIKKIYAYDGVAWQLVKYTWVRDGANWRQVHTNAFIFNKTFSTPASNYDLMNDIKSLPAPAAWNGTDDIEANITINPGVSVFSSVSGPTGYAMRISPNPSTYPGSSFPAGSLITLNNYGYIVGKGGTGGNGGPVQSLTLADNGVVGSDGSPALILAFSTKVTNFPGSFIASGGGGGGGGGGAIISRSFGKGGVAGASAGGSGGGGGAYGAPTGSASSKGLGGVSPPTVIPAYGGPPTGISPGNDGNDGTTSAGAGGAAKINSHTSPTTPFTTWTATGGAGGAGGDKGNSGSTGENGTTSATGPLAPGPSPAFSSTPYVGSGASGGAAGSSIIGTSFYAPSSSVPAPTIFGPTTA